MFYIRKKVSTKLASLFLTKLSHIRYVRCSREKYTRAIRIYNTDKRRRRKIKIRQDDLPLFFGEASIVLQDDTKDQSDGQAGGSKDALNNDSVGMRGDGVCQSGAPSCLGSLLIIIDVARTLYKLETRLPRTPSVRHHHRRHLHYHRCRCCCYY